MNQGCNDRSIDEHIHSHPPLFPIQFRCSPQFANPVYELSNSPSPRTKEQMEADIANRQNMLAASSTDDITLISKRKKVSKTRSSEAYYRYSDPTLLEENQPRRNKGLKLPLSQVLRANHQSYKAEKRSGGKRPRSPLEGSQRNSSAIRATDIDTGQSVLVASQDNLEYQQAEVPSRGKKASSCSPSRSVNPPPPKLKTTQAHAHSRSFDSTLLEPGSKVKHRNNMNSELKGKCGVLKLREKFETPPPSQPAPLTSDAQHQSRSQTGTGHRNSTENSDSGRESMVLDSDHMSLQTATAAV